MSFMTPGAVVFPSNPDYCPLKLGPGFPKTMTDIPHILSDDTSQAEAIIRRYQGQGVVGNLCGPPHLVPDHIPDADKINKLLRANLMVQSARCAAKPYCLLSTADLAKCGVMRKYLKSVGVDCEVATGWLCGRKVGLDSPCTWLEIAGETINISYCSTSTMYFPYRFLTTKEFVKCRLSEDVKKRLAWADNKWGDNYYEVPEVNRRYSRLALDEMELYGNNQHIGKFNVFQTRFR